MTTTPEREAGLSYADLGIDVSRCRSQGDCKTFCPRCHDGRKNRQDKSLSVNLDRGEWKCHHCQWASGLGVMARERLSGRETPTSPLPRATAVAPRLAPTPRTPPHTLIPEALDWFRERAIPEDVLAEYGVGSRMVDGKLVVYFPYTVGGKLVNVKRRSGELPALKQFGQEKDAERSLFGVDQAKGSTIVVITEGECLTGDTEVLTPRGWIRLDAYDGTLPVVQYHDDGASSLAIPEAIVRTPFSGSLIRTENTRRVSVTTTPEHRMVARDKHGKLVVHPANRPPSARHYLPRSTILHGEGIPWDDDQIRFAVAVSADTSIRNDGDDDFQYRGRYGVACFSKGRKIERFRALATACGVPMRESVTKGGMTQFLFHLPEWLPGKDLPARWATDMTLSQKQVFLAEIVLWDGNTVPNRTMVEYATNRPHNADVVQAIAHTAGLCATQIPRKNAWGEWIKVTITQRDRASWKSLRQFPVPFEGDVWCLKVPSGMMMVRHEGCVTITGNCDVLACAAAGWSAVSAPDGAPGKIRDADGTVRGIAAVGSKGAAFHSPSAQSLFAGAERIVLATDGDDEGQALASWLIEQLGPQKCWQVSWPAGCKDANDVLRLTGVKGLDEVLGKAKPVPLPGVRSLAVHREKLHRLYHEGFAPGVTTGWPSFDFLYRPTLGQLLVLSGYPGHGKTTWTNHFFVNLAMYNDWKIAIYSPEMGEDGEVLGKFVQVAADAPYLPSAVERMSLEAMDLTIDWVGERFFEVHSGDLHNDEGFSTLTVPQILDQATPLVIKHGIRVLQIDPWNECESARPKHMTVEEYISTSLTTIRAWGRRHNVITAIVIHPRKPEMTKGMKMEESAPHPYESAGAAHWYNKADVFLTVHRMKWGERKGITTVAVKKHRREGISGNIGECEFSFDRRSERFYCDGTLIPDRPGANPYVNLPDHLRLSPAPVKMLALPGYEDGDLPSYDDFAEEDAIL